MAYRKWIVRFIAGGIVGLTGFTFGLFIHKTGLDPVAIILGVLPLMSILAVIKILIKK